MITILKSSLILVLYTIVTYVFSLLVVSLVAIISNYLLNSLLISFFIIVGINSFITLSFIIESKIKNLINNIILGLLPILILLIGIKYFTNTNTHKMISIISDSTVVVIIFSLMLLINTIAVLYLSIIAILFIPKYKKKHKEKLKSYYKLVFYATVFAGIFLYLLYVYR